MTTPANNTNLISMRRARVAQLKLRGLSSREIALALANGDANGQGRIISAQTGQPFDHATILNDLKVLEQEWREARLKDTETHVDRQFAEINEIKRAAWAKSDPKLALEAIDREMRLLGTGKPLEFKFTFDINIVMQLVALIEQRGEDVNQWLMELVQEFYAAEPNQPDMIEGVANADRNASS